MTQIILSGKAVNADVEAAPVGVYDLIRVDVRSLSTVQPINRVFVERTEIGYRGILFSNEKPYMFALNGNGFVSKPLQDSPQIIAYCNKLEDDERELTMRYEAERADRDIDVFNDNMDTPQIDPRNYTRVRTATVEEGPSATIAVWGPEGEDPIERVPGAYRRSTSQTEGKSTQGICGGGIVLNKEGKVLLVKPRGGYGGYDWTFPKGYPTAMDNGFREQTAVREVREETGYQVFANRFVGRFTHNDGGVCDYFYCDVDNSKQVGKPDPFETEEVRWASLVEALELLNDDVDIRILSVANNLLPKLIIKAGPHSGTMVALHLPIELSKKIAIAGGEEPASLHITLAYLGKGLSEDQKKTAASVVRKFAGTIVDGIKATLGGVGRFSASGTSEGKDVVYLSVDSPHITRLRPWLVDDLREAGLPVSEDHGFVPHVTLAYIDKKDDTPLKRFEPIELKFSDISLTIADQKMSFQLKLSPENQKWHDIAVRNTQALKLYAATKSQWKDKLHGGKADARSPDEFDKEQLAIGVEHEKEHTNDEHIAHEIAMDHLSEDPDYYKKLKQIEKAERNVKNPGARGAKFWIDDNNQVRYDERPAADTGGEKKPKAKRKRISAKEHRENQRIIAEHDAKKPKIKAVGLTTVKPDEVYVHKNAMGVRFLRHTSDHEVDDEGQAVVRYAPFGKNIDGLSQGEVHFIFDELYHSNAKTMDEFLTERVQPVWDDEGGKNPFTIEKARTWMDHTLTYLEYDNAVAPGGKDLLWGRTDVDWKQMHEAAKKLPFNFDDSRLPEYAEPQRIVRDGLRKILSHFGITKPPMGKDGALGWHDRVARSTEGDIGKGLAAATHGWNGEIKISQYTYEGFVKFCEAMARDDGKTTANGLHYMRTMLHEELHGFSEMEPWAYQGVGMFVEEISTEVCARMVMRERFGHLRDVTTAGVSTLTGPGLMARGQTDTMLPSSGGSYGKIIEECIMIVAEVLAKRHESAKTDFPRPAAMFKDEAKHTLEQACLQLKKHHLGVRVAKPDSHLNEFVNSFKTLSYSESEEVAQEIEKLCEGKRRLGKLARE